MEEADWTKVKVMVFHFTKVSNVITVILLK